VNKTSMSYWPKDLGRTLRAVHTTSLCMLQQYVKTQRTLPKSQCVVDHTFNWSCSLTLTCLLRMIVHALCLFTYFVLQYLVRQRFRFTRCIRILYVIPWSQI
jgi:ABC-type sugar transport system permease subunit